MYKNIILNKVIDYLKVKKWEVRQYGKTIMLLCVYCRKIPISANQIPNTHIINCFNCKRQYNLINIVRELEPDKKDLSEEDILQYLKELLNIDITTKKDEENLNEVLNYYENLGFDLVPIATNAKYPIEKNWTIKSHKNKIEWKEWLENGLNLGVKTGKISNIVILDIDTKEPNEELKKLLEETKTLIQESSNGFHYFYQYENELSKTRIDEYKIDIETDGGQVVIYPSIINGIQRKLNKEIIAKMPDKLKEFLKSKITVPRQTESEKIIENIKTGDFKINPKDFQLKNNNLEGCCNSSFVSLGGILRQELTPNQTEFVLQLLNQHLLENPMDKRSIKAMCNELEKYVKVDEQELSHKILRYLQDVKLSTKNDLELSVTGDWTKGEAKIRLNKALKYLINEDKIVKRGKSYELIEEMAWNDSLIDVGIPINFKVPYLHDYAFFNWQDVLIIASKTKYGKSTLAMNIVKRLVDQGIKPYYLYSETGGRFAKIALRLGLKDGDFNHAFIGDPRKLILPKEDKAVIIFDWIRPPDFAEVDNLFAGLIEKVKKTNCFFISFMQLKVDNEYFAPNLLAQYPALVCKYLYENEDDGTITKFQITEIREGKLKGKVFEIPCIYDWDTKEVKRVEEVDENKKNI